jgi:hypothetical protein
LWLYDLYTKGSVQAISPGGGVLPPVLQADANVQYGFTTEVAAYLALAVQGADFGAGTDGSGSNGSGIVYVDPGIWNETDPTADCQPPCVIVLPPKALPTNTTISFPPYTTSLTETCNGTQVVVKTVFTIPAGQFQLLEGPLALQTLVPFPIAPRSGEVCTSRDARTELLSHPL